MSDPSVVTIHDKEFELFLERKDIKLAVAQMADEINRDYENQELVVLGVLDGAFMVLADLMKRLNLRVSLELVKLKSYDGTQSSGKVHKLLGLNSSLKDCHVLIVEDIIDSGRTLEHCLALVNSQHPKSVKTATLLIKEEVFKNRFPIHYTGISIPSRFVVGYGMDYDGQGRQLRHIYAEKE